MGGATVKYENKVKICRKVIDMREFFTEKCHSLLDIFIYCIIAQIIVQCLK